MCFNISLVKPGEDVSDRFDAVFDRNEGFEPVYHSSAFSLPKHPIICSEDPERIRFATWGLIPGWTKDLKSASSIRLKTLNARSETVFEKPSFRSAVRENRCLIPVSGFFEFREVNGKKFPYHIRMKDGRLFSLAGIYEDWEEAPGKKIRTFSIVTTDANELMARIHNTKKRMPVVLSKDEESIWIDVESSIKDLKELLKPYPGDDLEAYPVSRALSGKNEDSNLPFILEEVDYPELRFKELDSF